VDILGEGNSMFIAVFYFLGLAAFVLAASVCLSKARRAGKSVDVDLSALQSASFCLSALKRGAADGTTDQEPTWDEAAKWQEMKAIWMQWYAQCREKSLLKQEATYSWVRTLALCAALCLVGVVLEATFGEPITVDRIIAGFTHSPVATAAHTPQHPGQVARFR
jgi:hypothetical protein